MEETNVNGVTDHGTSQEPNNEQTNTHPDEPTLNGNDDVFQADSGSPPPLKTRIVLKSTSDETSSTVSEGDEAEKKYTCVIRARTSVEEHVHSREGSEETEEQPSKPLKVFVRTRSTEETTVETDNQTIMGDTDNDTTQAIAAQAKEIVQTLVDKLENEQDTRNGQKTEQTQEDHNLEQVSEDRTVVETSTETFAVSTIHQESERENEQQQQEPREDNVDAVVVVASKVESTPEEEKEDKAEKVTMKFESNEERSEEQNLVTVHEVSPVDDNKAQPAPESNEEEITTPLIASEEESKEEKDVETTQQEIPTAQVGEEKQDKAETIAMKFETKSEEADEETLVKTEETTNVEVSAVAAKIEDVEAKPDEEDKVETIAMKFETRNEEADEETLVTTEETTNVEVSAVAAKVEEVEAKPDEETKAETETIKFESKEEQHDEENLVTTEETTNVEVLPAEVKVDEVEAKPDDETKAETVAIKFESKEEQRDEENLVTTEETTNVEVLPAEVKVDEVEAKPDDETKAETVAIMFESKEEQRDEENLVTTEETTNVEVLPAEVKVDEVEAKPDEETKAETVAIKFESKEEQRDEENLVTTEETTNVEVLPAEVKVDEVEAKPDKEDKAETEKMKFESKEEQHDEESLVTVEETTSVEVLPAEVKVDEVKAKPAEGQAETIAMKFETNEEQHDEENFVITEETTEVKSQQVEETPGEVDTEVDEEDKIEAIANLVKVDTEDNQTVQESEDKAELMTMTFESKEEKSDEEQVITAEDVPQQEAEVETVASVEAAQQESALSQAEQSLDDNTTVGGVVNLELTPTSTEDVPSTAVEGQEEPSSPKHEYVAEVFSQNTQSLHEIEEGGVENTNDDLEEKPIVKVRLAEEPLNTITNDNQFDEDVIEVKEITFDDHVLDSESSKEFVDVGEINDECSDSDGEIDVTVERLSQENEVLIKDVDSDDEGTADDWMAKDDTDEVVFKGTTAVTIVSDVEDAQKESVILQQEEASQNIAELKEDADKVKEIIQLNNVKKESETQELNVALINEIKEKDVEKDVKESDEINNVEEKETQKDDIEFKAVIVQNVGVNEKGPDQTVEVDAEMSVGEVKAVQVNDEENKESETIRQTYNPPGIETQKTITDDVIVADTKAITVCSNIGELFPPGDETEVHLQETPKHEPAVPEYDLDKEVEEELLRIITKTKTPTNVGSKAVIEEILPNQQRKKEMSDFNILLIDEKDEDIVTTTREAEEPEDKPPSPVEAKKVTEEGITEIFETEELRRSGIFDDTLNEEDEESLTQAQIYKKDVVLANEEYLEAQEKEKRESLRWSLLDKWEELKKRHSLEMTEVSGKEISSETIEDSEEPHVKDNEVKKTDEQVLEASAQSDDVKQHNIFPKATEKNEDNQQALVQAPYKKEVDLSQAHITEYEARETSEPVVLETVTTETTPSSITTVKTTKTVTKTRVLKARSEVQPTTIQDERILDEGKPQNIEPLLAQPTYQAADNTPTEQANATATVITEQPRPIPQEEEASSQPEEAPMSTILFRMDGTPIVIPQTEPAQPARQEEAKEQPKEAVQPEMSTILFRMDGTPIVIPPEPQPKPTQPERHEEPTEQPKEAESVQPPMSTILFRMDGTPFVLPPDPPLHKSTPVKTVNFSADPSIRPISLNSVESVRGEHEGVPPLAGEEESDIDDSSLHLARHAGPSRAPTVSPVKEYSPPPTPVPIDDGDADKTEGVESPLLDKSQPDKGQKCCIIL